jgi:DHA1 family quinolone resistance protein-like MFS transporter
VNKQKLLKIFIINQTFHWFIVGIIVPVIALLQLEKGLNLFQIGISMAIYSGTIVLLELPTGGLSDTIGRKKVYLISLMIQFAAVFILLIAQKFQGIILGFLLLGMARAFSSGSMDAWFVDKFYLINRKGNLQEALAKVGIFIPLGLAGGSLLGGFLPMTLGKIINQIPKLGTYSSNLIAILLFVIIQYLLTSKIIVEEIPTQRKSDIISGFKLLPEVLSASIQYGIKNNIIFLLLLSTFAWGVGFSGLETFWQPQVKNILGSDSQTWVFGALTAGYFFAGSIGNVFITPLCKLFKNNYLLVLFFLRFFMGVMLFILALQNKIAGFTIFYLTLFLYNGMSNAPHATIFNYQIPAEKRSTLLSFESLFLQIGGLLGALIMGYISNSFSITIAWFIGSAILVLSCFTYLFLFLSKKSIVEQKV